MKLSRLFGVLRGNEDAKDFFLDLVLEVETYKKALSIRGMSAPVILDVDVEGQIIGYGDVRVLCDFYLKGIIDAYMLNYIAEAFLLSTRIRVDSLSRSLLEGLTEVDFISIASREYVHKLLDESVEVDSWIGAAILLTNDPDEKVVCPDCSKGVLSIRSEVWPDGSKVDRYLICSVCDSWNVVTINVE